VSNPNLSQRERSQFNPLNLGRFNRTSLRLLTGTLGPSSQIIQGGYGNYTYNHWFQVTLALPAWIILIKGGTALAQGQANTSNRFSEINQRFSFQVYDQNRNPIQGRYIHQEPEAYLGHVAGAQSDLYNTFNPARFDKGDETFHELEPGNYLICISANRNELFKYATGLVIEFPSDDEQFILLEDNSIAYLLQESTASVAGGATFIEIPAQIDGDTTLSSASAFTINACTISSGFFVQINNESPEGNSLVWIIGPDLNAAGVDELNNRVELNTTENWQYSLHVHSLSEWSTAWEREHQQDDKFPAAIFTPYTNAP
jgi:hypothetical protein